MNNVIVRLMDLPTFVKGQTLIDNECDYNIYINARFSQDVQCETLNHELKHVKNEDFKEELSVIDAENLIL